MFASCAQYLSEKFRPVSKRSSTILRWSETKSGKTKRSIGPAACRFREEIDGEFTEAAE